MSVAELHGVSKRFGRRTVLEDLSFCFEPATTYLVSGESGCGKSTLLNLIAGYVQPDSGRLTTTGTVGYLFQDELLFGNLTARQNLELRVAALAVPPGDRDPVVTAAAGRANVAHLLDSTVTHLSGGERQRVQLAGLLVASPDMVLMDEPTSKLDPRNQHEVESAVADLFGDRTVVVVSHGRHGPLAEGATRLRMHEGRLDHE